MGNEDHREKQRVEGKSRLDGTSGGNLGLSLGYLGPREAQFGISPVRVVGALLGVS